MSMREAFRQAGFDVPDEPERRDEMVLPRDRQGGGGGGGRRDDRRGRGSGGGGGRRDDRRGRGGGGGRQDEPLPEFPAVYFGTDREGNRYRLTDFVAREKVDVLASGLGQRGLTTGQLRRFYNYCRSIERQLKVEGYSWQQVAADFEKLAFHAQYAQSSRKIPWEFRQFIDANVGRVKAAEGQQREAFLEGFLPHFEALVGFAAAHLRDN